jgi:hypothetical protein
MQYPNQRPMVIAQDNACLPRQVTANWVHSEWLSWHRTRSAISVIIPASFAVPSMLYTGIMLVRGHVGMLFNFQIDVNETSHCSAVHQCLSALLHHCVHHLNLNVNTKRH